MRRNNGRDTGDAVEKVKKTLEGLAEMMVKTMSDVLYLRKELQEQKEYTENQHEIRRTFQNVSCTSY